jgi:hypothetical protein
MNLFNYVTDENYYLNVVKWSRLLLFNITVSEKFLDLLNLIEEITVKCDLSWMK